MMKMKAFIRKAGFVLLCLFSSVCVVTGAQAGGMGLDRSRLVFNENDTTQTVTLYNRGDNPYLVQTSLTQWGNETPVTGFAVIPPLFRLEPQGSGALRIIRTADSGLPHDRESVFLLRIGTIEGSKNPLAPQKSSATLGISLGFVLKVFWRPAGLAMTQGEAYGRLTFHRKNGQVVVSNPTPYYQTFASLSVGGKKVAVDAPDQEQMVAPSGEVSYPLPAGVKNNSVEWTLIDDFAQASPVQKGTLK